MIQSATLRTTAVCLALVTVCGAAAADTVTMASGIPYSDVRVEGMLAGELTFRIAGRRRVTQPLAEIKQIAIAGSGAFNEAEQLRVEQPAKAVARYDAAARGAGGRGWMGRLIEWRRLDALGRAGEIERWAREWGELLSIEGEAKAAAKLRPAERGTPEENARAAERLEEALSKIDDPEARTGAKAVITLLGGEGATPPAGDGDGDAAVRPAPDDVDVTVRVDDGASSPRVRRLEELVAGGDPAAAIRTVDSQLLAATAAELPRMLYLAGMARLKAAQDEPERSLLREAGLYFMKLAVFAPRAPDVPEALLRAGGVCERLGDPDGARTAYQLLLARHADSEHAEAARERLAEIESASATPPEPETPTSEGAAAPDAGPEDE